MNLMDPLTGGFGLAILVALFLVWRSPNPARHAGILTSIGIFGTFVGISYALQGFDPGDIKGSVPQLIAGMTTAFWTSVMGIFASLLVRVRDLVAPSKERSEDKTVETLLAEQVDAMKEVRAALTGDGDTTLLSQLKMMRVEVNDRSKEILTAFQTFAEEMTKSNTDALIDALNGIIRDFNKNLTEQFGENFKQLNEAVEKLVTWQEQYRTQVETSTELLNTAAARIGEIQKSFEMLKNDTVAFNEMAERLETVVGGLDALRTELDGRLEAFADMADKAGAAMPTIQTQLEDLTAGLTKSVLASTDMATQIVAEQKKTVDGMGDEVRKVLTEMDREIRSIAEKNRRAIEEQVKALDKELENALTNSLNSLGNHMASISNRFAQDYGPLADRLREIVRLAEGL